MDILLYCIAFGWRTQRYTKSMTGIRVGGVNDVCTMYCTVKTIWTAGGDVLRTNNNNKQKI
jgi:hypothetical protein